MKLKKLSLPTVPARPAADPLARPRGPRFLFFAIPPATVPLRLGEIAAQIPDAAKLPGFNGDRVVDLPCGDFLSGPSLKLMYSQLAELAPDDLRSEGVADFPVRLPAGRLALAYRFIDRKEVIDDFDDVEPSVGGPAPVDEGSAARDAAAKESAPASKPLTAGAQLAPGTPEKSTAAETPAERPAMEPRMRPAFSRSAVPPSGSFEPPPKHAVPILPFLRRREVPEETKKPDTQSIPKPRMPFGKISPRSNPLSGETTPASREIPAAISRSINPPPERSPEPAPEQSEFAPPPAEFARPPAELAPRPEPVVVETEHVFEGAAPPEIAEQDTLQAIFMTEEMLSVDRVVELCGGMPGIKACVLARGGAVLSSCNVPENLDLVSLSANALDMIRSIREATAKMGIGGVPAVTIHSGKGPITFFNQGDLFLLALHKDRGFVPGVREKLQFVIEELARGSLPLPVSQSMRALGR